MICQWCSYRNREGSLYCGDCGRTLQADLACAACGTPNPSYNPFCDSCGVVLAGASHTIAAPNTESRGTARVRYRDSASALLRPIRKIRWVPKPGAKWETPQVVWPSSRSEFRT